MKSITIKVEGMCCAGCANSVQTALNKVDSVVNSAADIVNKTVTIEYDGTEPDTDSLRKAVADSGYQMVQ